MFYLYLYGPDGALADILTRHGVHAAVAAARYYGSRYTVRVDSAHGAAFRPDGSRYA
jgi:hypothetical protein